MLVEEKNPNRDAGKRKRAAKGDEGAGRFRRTMLAAALVAVCLLAVLGYIGDYYAATEIAEEAMKGNERVQVIESENWYCFLPEEARAGEGIIFYPGGKVEETAYAPLMLKLAECGYEVYLMRMPARLAVLRPSAAASVIEGADADGSTQAAASAIEGAGADGSAQAGASGGRKWILMGHSLGGAMAASYAAGHSGQVSTLVLLAAYSTADLSESGITVISLYGSEDGVMNRDRYEKNRAKLPEDALEYVIDGGNHAGFGFYGDQKGDHPAAISRDEQQETVVDALSGRGTG